MCTNIVDAVLSLTAEPKTDRSIIYLLSFGTVAGNKKKRYFLFSIL